MLTDLNLSFLILLHVSLNPQRKTKSKLDLNWQYWFWPILVWVYENNVITLKCNFVIMELCVGDLGVLYTVGVNYFKITLSKYKISGKGCKKEWFGVGQSNSGRIGNRMRKKGVKPVLLRYSESHASGKNIM